MEHRNLAIKFSQLRLPQHRVTHNNTDRLFRFVVNNLVNLSEIIIAYLGFVLVSLTWTNLYMISTQLWTKQLGPTAAPDLQLPDEK